MNYSYPNSEGRFGKYGGRYVPETLMTALYELTDAYEKCKNDPEFLAELNELQADYNNRPTPLTFSQRMTDYYGKAKIYLKREDLAHTGSHKLNNTLGQILLAKRLGKKRIIAETGAGQHGVATATVCAKFGLECVVYMGSVDVERQRLNVFRMNMLGAEVVEVESGSKTLKDATNEAIRDWIAHVDDTYYIFGSVMGPHPYPMLVRDFQSVIGIETKAQLQKKEGRLPDYVLACVGGGSNAMGIFHPFINDESVRLLGIEAGGYGLDTNKHSATLSLGSEGILHGMLTYILQNEDGQVAEVHSISAGLDYPGVGPEHSLLKDIKRAEYYAVTDDEALKAIKTLSMYEGILPALESAHAVAYLEHLMPQTTKDQIVVVNISGRGDKDVHTIMQKYGK